MNGLLYILWEMECAHGAIPIVRGLRIVTSVTPDRLLSVIPFVQTTEMFRCLHKEMERSMCNLNGVIWRAAQKRLSLRNLGFADLAAAVAVS